MGRTWRIEYEGGLYHVLSRGNERKDLFHDDRDRLTLGEADGGQDHLILESNQTTTNPMTW